MLTSFKDEERRYIKPGAGKDVSHLVEDLDRVMAKHKATFQISPNSTTCEARKGKSTEKRWKKRKLAACESSASLFLFLKRLPLISYHKIVRC